MMRTRKISLLILGRVSDDGCFFVIVLAIFKDSWRREMFQLEIAKKIAQKMQTIAHGDIISEETIFRKKRG